MTMCGGYIKPVRVKAYTRQGEGGEGKASFAYAPLQYEFDEMLARRIMNNSQRCDGKQIRTY